MESKQKNKKSDYSDSESLDSDSNETSDTESNDSNTVKENISHEVVETSTINSNGKVININSMKEYNNILQNAGNNIVISDFTAKWCGPCKRIAPLIDKMAAEEEYKNVLFLKVDVDDNEDISFHCKISCMPTFLFYKKNELLGNVEGANLEEIKKIINNNK